MTFQKIMTETYFTKTPGAARCAAENFPRIKKARLLACGLALLVCFFAAHRAEAATITVTNNNDSGTGSLRQAVEDAAAGDTIVFAGNVTGTITLTEGEIYIDKSLTIQGPGARTLAISGNQDSQVFFMLGDIETGIFVTISGLTIRDGESSGGEANVGGGIAAIATELKLNNVTLTNNHAAGGGGVYLDFSTGYFTNVTVSGNDAEEYGGGIWVDGAGLELSNCTISGNSVTGVSDPDGGGIYNNGFLRLTNSTVTNNTGAHTGGIVNSGDSVTLLNTIVAGNTGGVSPDVNDEFGSYGNNLIGSTAGSEGFGEAGSNDIVNTSADLLPLANNGGQTDTHALLPTSQAFNAGNNCVLDLSCEGDGFNPTEAITTDQRGVSRPRGGVVDIGSFELVNDSDLALALVVSPDPVAPGGASTYQMTLTNNGDVTAQNIVLTQSDFFRQRGGTRLTVQSIIAPPGFTCRVGPGLTDPPLAEVVCRGNLAGRQQAQFTVVKRQRTPLARGMVINHEAEVKTDSPDSNAANNRAFDTSLVGN